MIRVIPCLDVNRGRVVKGVNFVDLRDAGDPVELASTYDREGADELVFLDITASHEGRGTIVDLARRTAEQVFIPFTIGGGIRSDDDMYAVLEAGADKVAVNSAALRDPGLVERCAARFGSQCVVVAIDAKAVEGGEGWEVFLNGGRVPAGRDAVAYEIQDECDGHPEANGRYHYHSIPTCILDAATSSSTVVGFAYDGFPIVVERDASGALPSNADLDECHGRTSEIDLDGERVTTYHYSATLEFPYFMGCFAGTPVSAAAR